MSKQRVTAASKRTKKQERREEERRQELKRQQRQRNTLIIVSIAAVVIIAGLGFAFFMTRASANQPAQANTGTTSSSNVAFAPVNNVSCDSGEHYDYHHHIHLSMYIDGQPTTIPQNIGINASALNPCLYWIHTHDPSGVVHIESPVQRTYTLGNFFAIWSERFAQLGYPTQLGLTSGWQIYVNGQPYKGDFRNIPMDDHTMITMAYNSPGVKPETTYNWNGL